MKISVDTKAVEKLFSKSKVIGEQVVRDAGNYFRAMTPIRTGNARQNTSIDIENRTIEADYPYASVLDAGRRLTPSGMRGSTQAPNGMTQPTINEINRSVKRELGKL